MEMNRTTHATEAGDWWEHFEDCGMCGESRTNCDYMSDNDGLLCCPDCTHE